MSKPVLRLIVKFNGIEREYFSFKVSRDGSIEVIPKFKMGHMGEFKKNDVGEHVSIHASGCINIRSRIKDHYDVFSNPADWQQKIQKKVDNAVEILYPAEVMILDYGNVKRFVAEKIGVHYLDLDAYFENCEVLDVQNFDFVNKYPQNEVTLLVMDKNGRLYFARKDKPGFGLPAEGPVEW